MRLTAAQRGALGAPGRSLGQLVRCEAQLPSTRGRSSVGEAPAARGF